MEEKPLDRLAREKIAPVWDISQERMFIETLLNQRFNLFLVFYSITLVGFVNSNTPFLGEVILVIGSIVSIMFTVVLMRTQHKLDEILKIIFTDSEHAATIINSAVGHSGKRKLIGRTIPIICCIFLCATTLINLAYIIYNYTH